MAKPVGSLYGYQILLAGTRGPINRLRRVSLAKGLVIVTADPATAVQARLSPYTLDSIAGAVAQLSVGRLTKDEEFRNAVEGRGWDADITFRPVTLRRLMDAAVRGRGLPDEATRPVTVEILKAAEDGLHDVLPRADAEANKTKAEIDAMALRALQVQFADQLGFYQYHQEVAVCLQTIAAARERGLDLDDVFRRAYGCSFGDITFVTFGMFAEAAAARDGAQFNPRDLNKGRQIRNLADATVEAVWDHCAMTYEEYKSRLDVPSVLVSGYEAYALSPLVKWPLVVRSDGNAVAPVAGDLLHRGPRVFEVDALQALEKVRPEGAGTFSRALGEAYERYVGDSLERSKGAGEVRHGSTVFRGDKRHCDWVCIAGREVVLVEVKSVWVHLKADVTKERERLKMELAREGNLADALIQLDEAARAIRERETPLAKNSHLAGLIVMRGEQVGLNSPYIRGVLEEIVAERGREPPIVKYQLTNDVGFSHIVKMLAAGRHSLGHFLQKKMGDGIHAYDDMHFAVERVCRTLPEHPLVEKHAALVDELFESFAPGLAEAASCRAEGHGKR